MDRGHRGDRRPGVETASGRGPTSYDVARHAGVSQSAVSRCYQPGASVAPHTRARILKTAALLGYEPDAIARSLITKRSGLVAVVISNLTNLHYPEVLAELTMRLSERQIRVLLFALAAESEIDATLGQLWRYRVDGAIFAVRLSPTQLGNLRARGVATLLYNRVSDTVASVACEFDGGERLLVDALIAGGARRFSIIGGPLDSAVGEARVQGALAHLAAAGLQHVPVERGDFSYEGGHLAFDRLWAADPSLDAVIAANDTMALGAVDAARFSHGIRVPDQLSVVGFDGVAPARFAAYNLTTMRQPVRRMTEAAVDMLVERIENPKLGAEQRIFAGELIRGATARLGTL